MQIGDAAGAVNHQQLVVDGRSCGSARTSEWAGCVSCSGETVGNSLAAVGSVVLLL